MLTGDKLETAENIAKSCNLITNDMNVYVVKLTTILPQERIDEINQKIDVISIEVAQNILQKKPKAFLIEGETLCMHLLFFSILNLINTYFFGFLNADINLFPKKTVVIIKELPGLL